uniref:Kinesin motor domain-containing protein n=1 Tax=Macrostomum lignano TaxID=282301 RepID=A0A1I8F8D7_9PLAT
LRRLPESRAGNGGDVFRLLAASDDKTVFFSQARGEDVIEHNDEDERGDGVPLQDARAGGEVICAVLAELDNSFGVTIQVHHRADKVSRNSKCLKKKWNCDTMSQRRLFRLEAQQTELQQEKEYAELAMRELESELAALRSEMTDAQTTLERTREEKAAFRKAGKAAAGGRRIRELETRKAKTTAQELSNAVRQLSEQRARAQRRTGRGAAGRANSPRRVCASGEQPGQASCQQPDRQQVGRLRRCKATSLKSSTAAAAAEQQQQQVLQQPEQQQQPFLVRARSQRLPREAQIEAKLACSLRYQPPH